VSSIDNTPLLDDWIGMTISISAYLKLDPVEFAKSGAFDAILDIDSKLFIDPHLLKYSEAPELKGAYNKVTEHFAGIIKLLSRSKRHGDIFWREAARKFHFKEVKGLCIGYSAKSTSGSGMGEVLQNQLLETAKAIIDAGIDDPEIFELMGLFEENIGADRISDMVARIILPDLILYSERIFAELGVTKFFPFKGKDRNYRLPMNWHNRSPIILVPQDVLRDLPMVYDLGDIDNVSAFNDALRRRFNRLVGTVWLNKRPTKRDYKAAVLGEPEIVKELVSYYRDLPASRYDFTVDPSGQYIWYKKSVEYAFQFPLELKLSTYSIEEVYEIVLTICGRFKQLIEQNGLHSLLYSDKACLRPKHEEACQKLFLGIANAYCQANNLDLSPETNSGRGAVDFKFSSGYSTRVLVETKLSSNRKLIHGFQTQLAEYQKAEETMYSVYLVIDVGGCSKERWKEFNEAVSEARQSGERVPEVIIIDAKQKESASRFDKDLSS
jgi:hypothetical protein